MQSDPLVVNGLEFRGHITSPILQPAIGAQTSVDLTLEITNKTGVEVRLCVLDAVKLQWANSNGAAQPFDGGRNGTTIRPPAPILSPGKTLTLRFPALLLRTNEGLRLQGSDGFGGIWYIDGISTGLSHLRFRYETPTAADGCWKGSAVTAPLRVLVEGS